MIVLAVKRSKMLTFMLTTTCCQIPNIQGSEKNNAVELADMVSRGSTDYQWEVRVWRENRL